jgi:hypothetical protein
MILSTAHIETLKFMQLLLMILVKRKKHVCFMQWYFHSGSCADYGLPGYVDMEYGKYVQMLQRNFLLP